MSDKKTRCSWVGDVEIDYHDKEWGFPTKDDRRLFEKICLESFQSGLSWRTILVKRENFRKAFDNFEYEKIANYKEADVERLLQDEGIVRHRGKINAVINNAQRAKEIIEEFGSLAKYFWQFEPKEGDYKGGDFPATTEESTKLSKDLKKRGWKFVGPTTVYAFMQANGMVNDHSLDCFLYDEIVKRRREFERP